MRPTMTLKLLRISSAMLVCFGAVSAGAADLLELLRKAQAADAGKGLSQPLWRDI